MRLLLDHVRLRLFLRTAPAQAVLSACAVTPQQAGQHAYRIPSHGLSPSAHRHETAEIESDSRFGIWLWPSRTDCCARLLLTEALLGFRRKFTGATWAVGSFKSISLSSLDNCEPHLADTATVAHFHPQASLIHHISYPSYIFTASLFLPELIPSFSESMSSASWTCGPLCWSASLPCHDSL